MAIDHSSKDIFSCFKPQRPIFDVDGKQLPRQFPRSIVSAIPHGDTFAKPFGTQILRSEDEPCSVQIHGTMQKPSRKLDEDTYITVLDCVYRDSASGSCPAVVKVFSTV